MIDTHTHASEGWMQPVESLIHEMKAAEVDKALLVQLRYDYDNSYVIECIRRYPGQFLAVVGVDIAQRGAADALAALVDKGAAGIRIRADERSPGSDPFALWAAALDLNTRVSALGSLEEFADRNFRQLIESFRRLPVILEHLGGVGPYWGPGRKDKTIALDLYAEVLSLARYPNVFMKVPGMGELRPRPVPMRSPPFDKTEPLIDMAVSAFGASRLMWGSDFPPSAGREGYGNALKYPRDAVRIKSEADVDRIFGGTAASIFNFGS